MIWDGARNIIEKTIAAAGTEQLPSILADLELMKARAWARLTAGSAAAARTPAPAAPKEEKVLTPEEAAAIAAVDVAYLNRKTRGKKFRRDLSRKRPRYEEQGFRAWMATQGTQGMGGSQ